MKRKRFLILTALVIAVSILICSCSRTSVTEHDDKAGLLELAESFFAKMKEGVNVVITVKNGDTTLFVETIDGENSFVEYPDGHRNYALKIGSDYYSATDMKDYTYKMPGEGYYRSAYCTFLSFVKLLDLVQSEAETEYRSCLREEKKTGTATFTFEVASADLLIKLNASSENGLVQSLAYTKDDSANDTHVVQKMTFEYGTARVTVPDITNWEDRTAPN